MLCTVSTIKDTRANVTRFVDRNLAAGVDHLFVFLDAPDPEVESLLSGHAHVSAVVTDDAYWKGRRPSNLNTRQVVNANVANCVLAGLGCATWLFHIDGDECLDVDRDWLLAAPPAVTSVRLEVLEAVSREHWEGEVTHFKRFLGPHELALLVTLGVIEKPKNKVYFRGHQRGKSGIRPSLDTMLRVHGIKPPEGAEVKQAAGDHLRVLHYESWSGDEYVRKWLSHGGASEATRRARQSLMNSAVHEITTNAHLTAERRAHFLREVYRKYVADDMELLDELGYLVEPPVSRHRHVPDPLAADRRVQLDELLGLLAGCPKGSFRLARGNQAMEALLRRLLDGDEVSAGLRESLSVRLGPPGRRPAGRWR